MKKIIVALVLVLASCGGEDEKEHFVNVLESKLKLKGCLEKLRIEADMCIVREVRDNHSPNIPECLRAAKLGRKACVRTYSDIFATCEEPEDGEMSDFNWMEDDRTPTTFIDCPEDVSGPGYVRARIEHRMPGICVRNELTGEVF